MQRMRIAVGQLRTFREQDLAFARQIGAKGVMYNSIDFSTQEMRRALGRPDWSDTMVQPSWTYEDLSLLVDRVGKAGLEVEALENVPSRMMYQIRTGGPDRERELDAYCQTIENMGRAGIPILGYSFMLLPVHRSARAAPGRGGAGCTAFDATAIGEQPLAFGRRVTADEVWDRFEYFIRRILPVAESAGVKLALHPDDPPMPELYGVARIFGDLPGHRRALEEIAPSPNHGLDFCCGTWGESGVSKMFEALEYFGAEKKLFYIHLRNIHGSVPTFQESFIDEGDFDEIQVVKTLHDVGFTGFIVDDHVPHMVDDTEWGHRGRAFATGYIKALVKAFG